VAEHATVSAGGERHQRNEGGAEWSAESEHSGWLVGRVYYQANRENPIFAELKSIIAKTSGIGDVLNEGLASLAERIRLAFVYGSIARGDEDASSDVDLMVIGEASFADVVSALSDSESKLGREINPTVYGPREFREKLAPKNHFLSTVAKEKKLFVIGDEHEFGRLGQ